MASWAPGVTTPSQCNAPSYIGLCRILKIWRFDSLDRLSRIDYPDGTYLTATYDAEGNTLTAAGFGFARSDVWDALNRVTSITFNFGPVSKTVAYTYDEKSNRRTMTYPEGQVVTYTWDGLDRLATLSDSILGSWTFGHDAGSRRTSLTNPSGLKTTYMYNKANWITKLETRTSGGLVVERFNYTHDHVGNRLTAVEENGNTTTYAYDNVYRLKSESYTGGLVINYTYDGVGNRLAEVRNAVTTSYTYDADNRVTARGTTTYGYDDNGNTVARTVPGQGTTTYAYDLENRLTKVTLANGTVTDFQYSVRGKRMSYAVNGAKTYLMYDFYDLSKLRVEDRIADYTTSGTLLARYIHGPGADEPLAVVQGSTYFYSANAIGTVTSLTTTSQTPVVNYEYEAFGQLRASAGIVSNPYRFAAREWDDSTVSYYFRARWYETTLGRFFVADPWKFVDGPNFYVYVNNNPSNEVDPKGLNHRDCRIPCFNGGSGGDRTNCSACCYQACLTAPGIRCASDCMQFCITRANLCQFLMDMYLQGRATREDLELQECFEPCYGFLPDIPDTGGGQPSPPLPKDDEKKEKRPPKTPGADPLP